MIMVFMLINLYYLVVGQRKNRKVVQGEESLD